MSLKQRLEAAEQTRNNNRVCKFQMDLIAPIEAAYAAGRISTSEYRQQYARAGELVRQYTRELNHARA